MQNKSARITLRIDVDYPYPSRIKSFISTGLGIKTSKDYLKNSKTLARIINESPENIKAYWFFTIKTIPDNSLLAMLNNDKHEVALHVVNQPQQELTQLEEETGRRINYYTIHGTSRLLARIMWKRFKTKAPPIPKDFPLKSFHDVQVTPLDVICHTRSTEQALKIAEDAINEGKGLEVHPIWLFQGGRINRRGPFYETLRRILKTDNELESLVVRRKLFFKIANDTEEYSKDVRPTEAFIGTLGDRGIDIFTFIERKWCNEIANPPPYWLKAADNVGLLQVTTFDEWWKSISKKTRNMVRKAEKAGVRTEIAEPNARLAEGIWRIYNETPIRQERAFPHYGVPLKKITQSLVSANNSTFISAWFQDELAGFIELIRGDKIAIVSQILSLQKHADKAVNNALIGKAVEFCAEKKIGWIMYGRIGNHPSLDRFKQSNGFSKFELARYYIPLTWKGRFAARTGLHRDLKDALPQRIKYPLIPLYNWVSRKRAYVRYPR